MFDFGKYEFSPSRYLWLRISFEIVLLAILILVIAKIKLVDQKDMVIALGAGAAYLRYSWRIIASEDSKASKPRKRK